MLIRDNSTKEIKQSLRILLDSDFYKVKLERRGRGNSFFFTEFYFNDNQKAHHSFWNLYERPPKEEYWDYLIERRDTLIPVDIRERKGAFFTPQIWVQKAQEYLFKALGKNHDEEYYIWDCAAGTGNLLYGLTIDKYKIYASTLDKADVEIMQDLYGNKSLVSGNIFQFDFLNDCFFDKPCSQHKNIADSACKNCKKSKLPESLQKILKDEYKRQKLIIFINPPYAEAGNSKTETKTGEHKPRVATENATYEKYKKVMGNASNELFAQFFFRIYNEIPNCVLASFSTLKYVNASNFVKFRETFEAKFLRGFICPAFTFDNVKGSFPIGFLVWNLGKKVKFRKITLDIFEKNGEFLNKKSFYSQASSKANKRTINHWLREYRGVGESVGILMTDAPDFQQQRHTAILNYANDAHLIFQNIAADNLLLTTIYFAIRLVIPATWINNRDQFLYPNHLWKKDYELHSDCLAFMLFSSQNKITSKHGINHFIPFSESQVMAKDVFSSNFMYNFINGKIKQDVSLTMQHDIKEQNGFDEESFYVENLIPTEPLEFSEEAKGVFAAGLKLWQYYHSQNFTDSKNPYNPNASLYDIKAHFQGVSASGRMNPPQKAKDSYYKDLIGNLNYELENLAKKIEPKVYEYGFLSE